MKQSYQVSTRSYEEKKYIKRKDPPSLKVYQRSNGSNLYFVNKLLNEITSFFFWYYDITSLI